MAVVFLYRNYNIEGKQVYAYLSVKMDKVNQFRKIMMKEGSVFNLKDYGTILASGYGDPTPEVMLDIEKKFGLKPGNYLDAEPFFTEEFDKKIYEYNAFIENQNSNEEGTE